MCVCVRVCCVVVSGACVSEVAHLGGVTPGSGFQRVTAWRLLHITKNFRQKNRAAQGEKWAACFPQSRPQATRFLVFIVINTDVYSLASFASFASFAALQSANAATLNTQVRCVFSLFQICFIFSGLNRNKKLFSGFNSFQQTLNLLFWKVSVLHKIPLMRETEEETRSWLRPKSF